MLSIQESAQRASLRANGPDAIGILSERVRRRGTREAVRLLEPEPDDVVVKVLQVITPTAAQCILEAFAPGRRQSLMAAAPPECSAQWSVNCNYPEGSVGRLMDAPIAVFRPDMTVAEAVDELRVLVKRMFITYGFVADANDRLLGVLVMRDLLFADRDARLDEVMLASPFSLRPDQPLLDAMRNVLNRHYPVYPVCDEAGRLVGIVRGQVMFEAQAFEISAQAGSMVGVEKEERLATPWSRSFRFRHPWLQLNLLTAFVAGAVVSMFQDTIDQVVVLAVFLPILAGQSGNTGSQALAVALRGLTLGELKPGTEGRLVAKEGLLGLLNGALVGVTAALGMFALATTQSNPLALTLALLVLVAMIGSCVVSGVFGALVPVVLKRLGADPATASTIFLTTATDVVSMGLLLGLATWLVL
jgi:magnesium transporter